MNPSGTRRLLTATLLFALTGCGGDFTLGDAELDESGELEQEAVGALVVQGEAMGLKAGEGQVMTRSNSSGGKELQIWWNDVASASVTTGKISGVIVTARGDQCRGAPQMIVKVDGVAKRTFSVSSRNNASYRVNTDVPAGTHLIEIAFTNDNDPGCDKNLYVDRVAITHDSSSSAPPSSTPPNEAGLQWRTANLTWFESYPDPGSEECIAYNGCTWAGQFAGLSGKQPESWVRANNIAAIHSKDFAQYKLKTLRVRQGSKQVDVKVYDMCSDSDCNGCCTANSKQTGFLMDLEINTAQRFGSSSGIVEWTCLDCN
ncbi:MAG: carbohydrate-binding domain-containing protein [Myxococcaceae bacterium]